MSSIEYKYNEKGEYVAVYEGVEFTHTIESGKFLCRITSLEASKNHCFVLFVRVIGPLWWGHSEVLKANMVKLEPPAPFWHKYKKDARVLVRNWSDVGWQKAHYAGLCKETGKPLIFNWNESSWSSGGVSVRYSQIKDPKTGEEWVFGK